MSTACAMCSSNITKGRFPGVKCSGPCDKFYHVRCANITDALLRDIKNRSVNWLCETCRVESSQSVIDSEVSDTEYDVSLADIMKQLKKMERKLSALEKLKSENEALTLKIKHLEEQFTLHNSKLYSLEADMDKPIQLQNATSISISGLPAVHGDIHSMILNTISKIDKSIQADDIISIENVRKRNINATSNSNTSTSVLHNIFIVKLKTVQTQQSILSQMRKIKTLYTKDLDVILPLNHPVQRIHIMQRLSKFQARLYHEAKKIKTEFKYKYLWCKSGQIYLRESADSDALRIHSMNDLFRLRSSHH